MSGRSSRPGGFVLFAALGLAVLAGTGLYFERADTGRVPGTTAPVKGTVLDSRGDLLDVRVDDGVLPLGIRSGGVVSIDLGKLTAPPRASRVEMLVSKGFDGTYFVANPDSLVYVPPLVSAEGQTQPADRGPHNPDCGRPIGAGAPGPAGPPPKPCGPPPGRPASGA